MRRKIIALLILALVGIGVFECLYVWYVFLPSWNVKFGEATGIPNHAVIAHRGASYLAPEETEPAYRLARDLGADYLEMDIQRTKDHVLVAIHDDTPDRTTNVAQVFPGREKDTIEKFTLSELKQLDAGSWFNIANPGRAREKYAGVKILTLEEIVAIAEAGANAPSLYIETKSPERHPGYEQELVDLLKQKGWLGRFPGTGLSKVVFQSFDSSSLHRLKDLAPDVPRVYLINKGMVDTLGWGSLLHEAEEVGAGIGPAGNVAWPWNLGKAHRAALAVHVYTINENWQYRLLSFCGSDGFFTDRCDRLLRYYGRKTGGEPEVILLKNGY